jgi:(p)ppGpp synthase/HD superfamily hydrolase
MHYPNFSPYLEFSLKLAAKPRRGGGNMFRHQMETLAILLEFGYTNPVLLKAALIRDLVEDGKLVDFHHLDEIKHVDLDGAEVLALVHEVSRRLFYGKEEPKSVFLLRIMLQGTELSKILKLADRIANLSALLMVEDKEFISNYISETEQYILPYAGNVNPAMAIELKHSIELTLNKIHNEHNIYQIEDPD